MTNDTLNSNDITKKTTQLKPFYLFLTLIGTLIPGYQFTCYFIENGASPLLFFQAVFPNLVASALASDLVISSCVFWGFACVQLKKHHHPIKTLFPFLLLNLVIGLSCALPAFLWWQCRSQNQPS